jgi:ubiquinone/menaquinone biosynthesis C-methylase UbiE
MAGTLPLRQRLLAGVGGRVAEIGFGTGANLPAYPRGIDELWAIDPSVGFLQRARPLVERSGLPVRLLEASASRPLPLEAGTFDAVVITFVLCSARDRGALLGEARRLLRPGAPLLMAEHVAADTPGTAAAQRLIKPLWQKLVGGCDPAFDAHAALASAGFDTAGLERVTLPLPYPVHPGLMGRALPVADGTGSSR